MKEYGCRCGFNTDCFWIADAHKKLNPTHESFHRFVENKAVIL